MGKKRKKRQAETSALMAKGTTLAKKAYEGKGPSLAEKQMERQVSQFGAQARGAAKSERSPFMRALSARRGERQAGGMQAQSLGQLSMARAQEQLGALGMATSGYQQQGQARAAQKTGWEAIGAPLVAGIGGAASTFI